MATDGCHGRNFVRSLAIGAILFAGLGVRQASAAVPPPRSSIVEVAGTGRILEAQDPDGLRHPASLTKLMTLYMTFEALRDRRISLDQLVPVSAHAASMQPTKLGLVPGSRITVQQAILGLITRSANDAAVALGELLGGSETRFAQMMTLRAHALGMRHTNFVNASGLPAEQQWSTARDMALLARRLLADFPSRYALFSTPSFEFRGQTVYNLDRMLKLYPGVDGMKTGYVEASGHNIVTSAVRDGVRLIGVEFGARTNARCYSHMAELLDGGFAALAVPARPPVMTARATPTLPSLISRAHAEALPQALARLRHAAATQPKRRGASPGAWGIQVGSFRSRPVAFRAASHARFEARAGAVHLQRIASRGVWFWRAQVIGLPEHAAYDACHRIGHGSARCLVLGPARDRRYARR
ncbi:MAG: D-alanyl-D-alanine carboxypeptidase [Rhodospirillales bacterium]|nr:D-alanyl-D-alanine carboxypeptidase [Rhodospirillales bacterium]